MVNKLKPRHWTLQFKVMVWVVAAQLTLSLSVFFAVLDRSDQALIKLTEHLLTELDSAISSSLVDPLLENDYAALQRIADELIQRKAVLGIRILDIERRDYASSGSMPALHLLNKDEQTWINSSTYRKTSKIEFGGQHLGYLQYAISIAEHRNVREEAIQYFVLISLGLCLASVICVYYLSKPVISRIREIKHATDSARVGDYSQVLPISADDELGQLALGVNQLSASVKEKIEAAKKSESTIRQLAECDPLTKLFNRRSFNQALDQALTESPDQPLALVYLDLDNFKLLNDLKGHQEGDKFLVEFSNRLLGCTRSSDVVARIGGDEFVVLLRNIAPESSNDWCDRLLSKLNVHSFNSADQAAQLSCSVGIAWYPRDASKADELLAAADQAMYESKRSGKNMWRSFQRQEDRAAEKLASALWSERLNNALRNDSFEVFLQGIHSAETKEVHHLEALIRLPKDPKTNSYFSPHEFISFAEEAGIISQIDRWMITAVIALLAENPALPAVAVNISALSFADTWLPTFVQQQLDKYGVQSHRLHVELTETAALSDVQSAQKTVTILKSLGCQVCLDDFGSGFSSLAYLKLIDANYLKIDGLFIQGLDKDRENQVLLRAIVDIARSSGRLTVAEWIENEELLDMARQFGVDLVQGFHLSRPEKASTLVQRYSTKPALHELS